MVGDGFLRGEALYAPPRPPLQARERASASRFPWSRRGCLGDRWEGKKSAKYSSAMRVVSPFIS